jgi:hypothetical protein
MAIRLTCGGEIATHDRRKVSTTVVAAIVTVGSNPTASAQQRRQHELEASLLRQSAMLA